MARHQLNAGQNDRIKRLVWPHLSALLRTATYLTRNDNEAEDLVQETLVKAMKAIDTFKDGTNVKAWLMTILRRTHIDWIRAKHRRPDEVSLDARNAIGLHEIANDIGIFDEQWDEPEQLLNRFEDQTIIDALKTLPDEIRWTLLLVDVQQMDHAGASGVLDVPIGTIKSRTHRGRQMLRDHLYHVARKRGWVSGGAGNER